MVTRSLVTLLLSLFALPALAADLSGTWTGQITGPGGDQHQLTLQLKVDGHAVTGTITGGPTAGEEQPIVNGHYQDGELSFEVKMQGPGGESSLLTYRGKVTGNRIQGSAPSPFGDLPWEVNKK